MSTSVVRYDPKEERLNIITHGFGLGLSIIGAAMLVFKAVYLGSVSAIISSVVFGLSMIVLYAASTLYHSASDLLYRNRLQVFDHASIYFLIAGTYTPFTLITLEGTTGWVLFGVTWSLAIGGIILKLFYTGRYNLISTIMYVIMGWNIVFAISPLIDSLGMTGFFWLLAGGISYSLGAVLYLFENIKYTHAIFHLFVLAGTACHFIAIYAFVL
jgi:hemolysin III